MKKSKSSKKLVLLDSHAIIHRAYHALPEFSTSKGEPTGALYGLSTMLIKIFGELKPDYVVACLDLESPTYRHEAYETYKAGRAKIDDALVLQLKRAEDIYKAFGIPVYSYSGFEADDIIGTIVSKITNHKSQTTNIDVIIATGDADALQLVEGKSVQVYTLKKGINDTIIYDEKKVKDKYGFAPESLVDFKGLRGDPSDNIIGIAGIGEKTATTLIQEFGSIESIYKTLKKSEEKFRKAGFSDRIINLLKEGQEDAEFSKTIATIRNDAPIDFSLPPEWSKNLDIEKALDLFSDLEFRTMGTRLKTLLEKNGKVVVKQKTALSSPAGDARSTRPVGLRDAFLQQQLSLTDDNKEAKELGIMLWLIDSNKTNPTLEEVLRFCKTKDTGEAKKILEKEMKKRGVDKVFANIEKPIIPIVEEMNARGIKIDKADLQELSTKYHKELNKLEKSIWKDAGERFNINSPKVLGEILYKKLGLAQKNQKKTPTGAFSTKESELEKIKDKHPIIQEILEYRELAKLLSTYIDAIPPLLDKKSRLHSTFLQSGATTGRMASNNPNLQNIPNRTALGRAIRNAFVAEKEYKLMALDYSQIELRLAAILSGDKKLIEIFKNGEDVHAGVASRVFGIPKDKVDKGMRIKAKTINFGILYGMGVNALKVNLGTDRKEAQEFYNQYFKTFTGLAKYIDKMKTETNRKGYTETMFGRRRYFSGFNSPLPYVRAQAERMAINAPLQGTQADIIKLAMKRIDDYIKDNGDEVYLVLQVHDELVYEIKNDKVDKFASTFKEIMEGVLTPSKSRGVPILAEVSVGDNWGNMQEL